MRQYLVYGIINPVTEKIFYVGLTTRKVSARVQQHAYDETSAAYDVIQYIRSRGLREQFCTIDYFEDYKEALLFEQTMILSIKGLVNREYRSIRERKLVAYSLEDFEVKSMLEGKDTMVMSRYTDYDDVEEELRGRPRPLPEDTNSLQTHNASSGNADGGKPLTQTRPAKFDKNEYQKAYMREVYRPRLKAKKDAARNA